MTELLTMLSGVEALADVIEAEVKASHKVSLAMCCTASKHGLCGLNCPHAAIDPSYMIACHWRSLYVEFSVDMLAYLSLNVTCSWYVQVYLVPSSALCRHGSSFEAKQRPRPSRPL